ncbi:MAG: thiol reductant ABC exporter subunit CydC, partial [bacterium]|nr:thiol reductant ABC exporter subunit CydC [bacterium]
ADVLNRIVADIDALDNLYLRVISPSLVAGVMSILVVMFLGILDPIIALTVAFFLVPAGLGVPAIAWRLGRSGGKDLTHLTAELRMHILDTLQGLPELLVFGGHRRQIDSVAHSNRALLKCQLRMSHIRGLSLALITLFTGLAVIFTLYLAVNLVNRELLDGPMLALVMLAVMASFEAVLPLPLAYQYLGQTREAGRRLLEIVDTDPQVIFTAHSVPPPRQTSVAFERVCFRYDEQGPWVLNDFDLQIPAGRRVAVIGETGSGKSTLVHLLVRFWNPVSGCIRLGDAEIDNFSEPDLRRFISTVSQQPHMFNATLKENLLMACPDAGEDDLLSALKTTQLLEFVEGLPDGLNSRIGEAGQLLSGGQAKRVAVARAVLHNAPLWVLDEPTEGLDPITEYEMMQALKRHTAGKTLLLITHRLVDLVWMDQIVMLDQGRIVDQGSHAELLGKNERYAALHRRIA